jgi:hypothetical protein
VVFEKLPFSSEDTYTVNIFDESGVSIYKDSFTAAWYERSYINDFPQSGLVHPHCGFVRAAINGVAFLDEKIPTDLDGFWDMFQTEVLPKCAAWVNESHEKPAKSDQPFFKCLKLDIKASEPDYSLGIREDRISSLDFLHEDIYFTTLDYFRLFGMNNGGEAFTEPGLILPFIEKREGRGMSVKVTLSGYLSKEKQEKAGFAANELFTDSEGKLCGINFTTDVSQKRLAELLELQKEIKWNGKISFNGIETLDCRYVKAPAKDDSADWEKKLKTDVIGYDDYIKLNALLEGKVNVWQAAMSFQNRRILAYEFTEDIDAEVVSRHKLINSRPTIVINNRHHANEVSSTNSAYTLIFKLLKDEKTRDYLKRMNLVIVPFENADGGALGFELQKQNPNWLLHVARFNSVGRDFYHHYFTDTKYGESHGITNIFYKWLPDFLADNHGVPSHEWGQPYSGYVSPWFKGFWLPRGVFYGICTHVDNDETKKLFEAVADYSAKELNQAEDIKTLNRDLKDRHSKYAHSWMPNMYAQNYRNDLIYYFMPVKQDDNSKHAHIRYPQICSMEWITEISDETSQGEYMGLCSKTHHLADIGVIKLLSELEIEHEKTMYKIGGETVIKYLRKRPLKYKGG